MRDCIILATLNLMFGTLIREDTENWFLYFLDIQSNELSKTERERERDLPVFGCSYYHRQEFGACDLGSHYWSEKRYCTKNRHPI